MSNNASAIAGAAKSAAPLRPLLLVVLATICFAAAPTFANFAYAAGSDPTTLIVLRYFIGAPLALILLRGTPGPKQTITRRRIVWALVMGVIFVQQSWCYLAAAEKLPIGLAATTLYVYPLLVALLARVLNGERLGGGRIVAMLVAFGGVALAATGGMAGGFDAESLSVDQIGVAFALAAAVGVALTLVPGDRFAADVGGVGYTAWCFTAAALLSPILFVFSGGPKLPATAFGWVGAIGTGASFALAIALVFTAIQKLDALRVAVVANLEPLVATLLGFTFLGQVLTAQQMLGAGLLVSGVVAATLLAPRAKAGQGDA